MSNEIIISANSLSETSDLLINEDYIQEAFLEHFQSFEVFDELPGSIILQTGNSNKHLQIKGSDSSQIMVYRDGVKLNDPMSPSGSFNFFEIDSNLSKQIRIISAGAVTLYGQGSTGSLVTIIPEAYSKQKQLSLSLGYGSYRTSKVSMKYQTPTSIFKYNRQQTQGISSASTNGNPNADLDGEEKNSLHYKHRFILPQKIDFDISTTLQHSKIEFDNGPGATNDDPNNHGESFNYSLQSKFRKLLFNDYVESFLKIGRIHYHRRYLNTPDQMSSTSTNEKITSSSNEINLINHILVNENNTGTFGINYEYSNGEIDGQTDMHKKDHSIFSPYLFLKHSKTYYEISSGIRFFESNINDSHTKELNLKIIPLPKNLWLSLSTYNAIKYPSIYQLYSSYGNTNLKTEESTNYEITLNGQLHHQKLSINYFNKRFYSLIEYDMAASKYQNTNFAKNRGIILNLENQLQKNLTVNSSIMFLDSLNPETGQALVRRPKRKGSLTLNFKLRNWTSNLSMVYVGKREDVNNQALSAYTILNGRSSFSFYKKYTIIFIMNNILNKSYEQIAGYETPGRNMFLGLVYKI